ncbi:MAG: cation:proton antiporter, partial [Thiomargarita sp.]|nr:cation:proton antiporter [Thiomargarita sp.]
MHSDPIVFHIFIIFTGSAVLATLALYARQALLVGYIIWGIVLGPSGFALIEDATVIKEISEIGIIFLMFLLGLSLKPQDLLHTVRKTSVLTIISSSIFAVLGFAIAQIFGFTLIESLIIGASAIFSSTIIGLKLLPTTVLHHKHAGEIMVSILLLQDLIAILVLLILQAWATETNTSLVDILILILGLPCMIGFALVFERFILVKLIRKFDKIQEYIFLVTIGWCLGMAELAKFFSLSHEIGAFIGGVVLASSPIARFIAESLKPVRDFFLVIFFFALGANLNLGVLYTVLFPAIIMAITLLVAKPYIFRYLMIKLGEKDDLSLEIGFRLGQISEFSLLIAIYALNMEIISDKASYLIQAATIITFMFSSYYIVRTYPTPIAVSDSLRRD